MFSCANVRGSFRHSRLTKPAFPLLLGQSKCDFDRLRPLAYTKPQFKASKFSLLFCICRFPSRAFRTEEITEKRGGAQQSSVVDSLRGGLDLESCHFKFNGASLKRSLLCSVLPQSTKLHYLLLTFVSFPLSMCVSSIVDSG